MNNLYCDDQIQLSIEATNNAFFDFLVFKEQ